MMELETKDINEVEKYYGEAGYVYCDANELNFEALETVGFKYYKGHRKSNVGSNIHFIEISKECGLRVVISHCEELDIRDEVVIIK